MDVAPSLWIPSIKHRNSLNWLSSSACSWRKESSPSTAGNMTLSSAILHTQKYSILNSKVGIYNPSNVNFVSIAQCTGPTQCNEQCTEKWGQQSHAYWSRRGKTNRWFVSSNKQNRFEEKKKEFPQEIKIRNLLIKKIYYTFTRMTIVKQC